MLRHVKCKKLQDRPATSVGQGKGTTDQGKGRKRKASSSFRKSDESEVREAGKLVGSGSKFQYIYIFVTGSVLRHKDEVSVATVAIANVHS